ncbi:hypothetical protein BCD67_06535 [Oscillatoriales cyanobacterium USR001]|nr:hypothetical protein BCD67_06535 [Oscillatoriales cyanobacterium USR001]
MKTSFASTCRYCRHYTPEGRRGGLCQQLSAPVQGGWAACSLALPPFAPCWEEMEELVLLKQAALLESAIAAKISDLNPIEGPWSALAEISA